MKPMLAATVKDIDDLRFPLLASPKLDGIRAIVWNGQLVSRHLKPIPNLYITRALPLRKLEGLDGELIVGEPTAPDCFRKTTSGVMSVQGAPDFTFYVFDYISSERLEYEYSVRNDKLKSILNKYGFPNLKYVKLVPQLLLNDAFELHSYEQQMLAKGYEGVMLRSVSGSYKYGRSTLKEGHLLKLKRFEDSEAIVLAIVEQMENTNEKTIDNLGNAKRSSHKAGKLGKATTGALRVKDINTGVEFDVGTGLDDETRQKFWRNPNKIIGKLIKYKYFPTGSKDKPRHPVFLGLRED